MTKQLRNRIEWQNTQTVELNICGLFQATNSICRCTIERASLFQVLKVDTTPTKASQEIFIYTPPGFGGLPIRGGWQFESVGL